MTELRKLFDWPLLLVRLMQLLCPEQGLSFYQFPVKARGAFCLLTRTSLFLQKKRVECHQQLVYLTRQVLKPLRLPLQTPFHARLHGRLQLKHLELKAQFYGLFLLITSGSCLCVLLD